MPAWAARLVPASSALVAVANTIAARTWYTGVFWGLPAALFLGLSVWRGLFFCRWICPAGTLHSMAGRLGPRKRILRRRLNGILFWTILAAAFTGVPALLFLDPTLAWNRLSISWSGAVSAAALVPGLVFPLLLLLSAVQPAVWCTHLCPLRYLYELGGRFRRRNGGGKQKGGARSTPDPIRREIAAGFLLGLPLALLLKSVRLPASKNAADPLPILPPGAGNPDRFGALCTRCYTCISVCPSNVLRVRFVSGRPIVQLFTPELVPDVGFCDPFCNRCTQACPAGAIRPLSLEAKQSQQLGIALIRQEACLAWADGRYCMICQEFCPYQAIDNDTGPKELPRPVVNVDRCRGCGACQHECPSVRLGKAVIVYGVTEQQTLRPYGTAAADL
ncbi:MAG: 4Fe-4S dicluster domain-containing protein [Kiritimatiellaeota bacterium]|nr:4Fe-4S dicluster domain-containing protein [Kiritimatiellota bacterium]